MLRYVIKRLLEGIPLLFFISLILFLLMMNVGDPIATMGGRTITRPEDRERLKRQLGLDKPIIVQYFYWLAGNDWTTVDVDGDGVSDKQGARKGILRGDFGTSLVTRKPVTELVGERIPNTLILMVAAEVVTLLFAMLLGIYSALRQYSVMDNFMTTLLFVAYSMPIFFVSLASMYVFAILFKRWGLPYLPTVGMFDPQVGKTASQVLAHMVLPVFTLSVPYFAAYSRYIRGTMLEVMSQDYVRTAKSKGLPRRQVVYIHALKNAAMPIVTVVGLDLPFLLGGAVVTERIFAWPGMGRLFFDHVSRSDLPVVMGILMLVAVAVVLFQILTDVFYAWLDPRIRYD
ncbi:MAG TPA: ABC transporter permease [Anaerolineales bacterium]|nr:ABC transporter permease [Anaerolineales bacterium]HNN13701.1 ABC transporter permease [Anaerolineales bacterium]HNO31362.1 ABC transporter permease [Anaerolineales bacterium]